MQCMQNKAQQKLNKADETAKWNNGFMDSYFYFVTETKINFRVAPQQIIKKK